MNAARDLFSKLDLMTPMAYALIRIFLGIALFVRGLMLMLDPGAIVEIANVDNSHMWFSYITIGHMVGGLSLITGFWVRVGALIQLPILIGAVSLAQEDGLMMGGQSLELAVLVLFMLVIILCFGPGNLALGRKSNGEIGGINAF